MHGCDIDKARRAQIGGRGMPPGSGMQAKRATGERRRLGVEIINQAQDTSPFQINGPCPHVDMLTVKVTVIVAGNVHFGGDNFKRGHRQFANKRGDQWLEMPF